MTRETMNRDYSIKLWQLILAAVVQLVGASAAAGVLWMRVSTHDKQLEAIEIKHDKDRMEWISELAKQEAAIETTRRDLQSVQLTRFTSEQGDRLSHRVSQAEQSMAVAQSEIAIIKADIKDIKAATTAILNELRKP